jgi:hypothetical protein
MARQLKIYPGIGIARVGNSAGEFFLAPEIPGVGPQELTADDSVQPVRKFKDAAGAIRRQAVRFRIFEFEDGKAPREITAENGIVIEWQVELANEKAAAGHFVSEETPEDASNPRNPGIEPSRLIIKPAFGPIAGPNQTVKAAPNGTFQDQTVYLGELRTDAKGRLIVFGGRGVSASVPPGLPLGDGSGGDNDFANNRGWHDDVADGPISATVRIPGQPDQVLTNAAWVIVAPPDFAPFTNGITTLYDVISQASGVPPRRPPSFRRDILPILQAASGLKWVSSLDFWRQISTDYAQLALADGSAAQLRQDTLALLLNVEGNVLANFRFTDSQREALNAWANGDFSSDLNPPPPPETLTPDGLERASLSQAVGGGFFPGIEAGIRMTSPAMYSAPFRITDQPFMFNGVLQTPHAGFITRTMACPWQSDFFECAQQTESTVWWPAQRPIDVFIDPGANIQKPWIDSIQTHQALVEKFSKLGFVEPVPATSPPVLIEAERDPSVPHK